MTSTPSPKKATSMAELMASVTTTVTPITKGEIVKGIVTKLSQDGILVDINAKTEAVVLEKDSRLLRTLLSTLKVGDEVTVSVLNPESDMGNPVVSLRKFLDNAQWDIALAKQKNQEKVSLSIKDSTRGGYIVDSDFGLSGFLPQSQLVEQLENPQDLVGRRVDAYVQEVQRASNRIIFSQRPVLTDAEFAIASKMLKVGERAKITVSHAAPFGLFVTFSENPKLTGFIHVSEISWEEVSDIAGSFPKGFEAEAVVTGIDLSAKRIELSIKRLTSDPFQEQVKTLAQDQKVTVTVGDMSGTDIAVSFEHNGIPFSGIIRKEKVPPNMTITEGSSVGAIVAQIDARKRKIFLVPVLKEKPIGYR